MKDIAWVGQLKYFIREFNCQKSPFIDKEKEIKYYCIDRERDTVGRRFDEVVLGRYQFIGIIPKYYKELYKQIKDTRLRNGR